MPTPKKLPRWTDALWLALLAIYIFAGATSVPNHGDEAVLIYMGRDYHHVFVHGNLSIILFNREAAQTSLEMQLRLLNGTVSKNIYGWVTASNGLSINDISGAWNWKEDYDSNVAQGHIPQSEILRQARLASAAQMALAVALFFQFARMTLNRPTAFLASVFFALHPNVLINGRRAMMEGSHLLGLMLVLVAGAWLIRQRTWKSYALLGVCTGFAVAAKHPNALIAATVFCACLVVPIAQFLRKRGRHWQMQVRALRGMILTFLLGALVFLLLNPAWWSAPLDVAPAVIQLRQDLLQSQVENIGGYDSFGERVNGFFRFVFQGERQYFEAPSWKHYDVIAAQIGDYERSSLAGMLFIGESPWLGLLCLLLSLAGLISLARSTIVSTENKTLILVWIGGSAIATLLLTPLPWARYYLPLIPALVILVAHSLQVIATTLWKHHHTKADGVAVLD